MQGRTVITQASENCVLQNTIYTEYRYIVKEANDTTSDQVLMSVERASNERRIEVQS